MFVTGLDGLFESEHNVCVVGAGPVGIVAALELARLGQAVTLLESGMVAPDKDVQRLSDAIVVDPRRHADMSLAVQRGFGGTSNLWGGGCIPLEPVDFESRQFVAGSGWPISYDDFAKHIADACRYANCGTSCFEDPIPNLEPIDPRFRTDTLVRYSNIPNFKVAYGSHLRSSKMITVRFGATVTGIEFCEDGRVEGLNVSGRNGASGLLRAKAVVLACGGVETTRLLLVAQACAPSRFGGDNGALGRYYMGHLSGKIGDIQLRSATLDKGLDFYLHGRDAYVRRRLVPSRELQKRARLTNLALWPTLPPFKDHEHRDPLLSLAYLVLSYPPAGRLLVGESLRRMYAGEAGPKLPHLLNVANGLPTVARFIPAFIQGRFLSKQRLPGFHLRNKGRRYALHYHAEHLPNPASRIRLSADRDALGVPRVAIDIRFTPADADAVVRTHDHLACWLSDSKLGEISWSVPRGERLSAVLDQASDGVHQIGTARMATSACTGVVDRDCRIFGSANLFLAGSAIFPTSGHANPTLTAIALAIRFARHLAGDLSRRAVVT